MVTKATFLHNTKVTSSKMGEDKDRLNNKKKPNGNVISVLQMLHHILQYPEIVTNLEFIKVSTMPLELRAGTESVVSDNNARDGAYVEPAIVSYRKAIELEDFRLHTPKQVLILDDLKLSKLSVDKITQFSLRPPEFLQLFNELGNYFRWFHISNRVKETKFPDNINTSLSKDIFC